VKIKRLLAKITSKLTEWLFIKSMTSFFSPLKHLTGQIEIAEEV